MEPNAQLGTKDQNLLSRIRTRLDYHCSYWATNWREGDIDMKYVSGDPWPQWEKAARTQPGQERPMVVFDEAGQYINQVINQVRVNKRAIAIIPGPGASEDEAAYRGDRIRAIETKNNAQIAYITAAQNMIQRGMGYARIGKKRVRPDSFEQEITISPINNARMCSPDPDAKRPDFSDMKDFFVIDTMTREEFKRRWPDATITDFGADEMAMAPSWFIGDMVQVCEYWCIKEIKRKLLAVQDLQSGETSNVFADELKEKGLELVKTPMGEFVALQGEPVGQVVRAETSQTKEVYQYITNGLEILEANEWDGEYIPFGVLFGKQYWVNDELGMRRIVESLVRKARDPIMTLCYIRSTMIELIASAPKTPYWGYEGQFTDPKVQFLNKTNLGYIEVPPVSDAAGATLPLPRRDPIIIPVDQLEIAAEATRRAIQAAFGLSTLPTAAQRRNEKSGIALQEIAAKEEHGSYHLIDNYNLFIQHMGVMINDLITKLEDTPRQVDVRRNDDSTDVVTINQPYRDKQGKDRNIQITGNPMDVVVTTGPAFTTSRQQASAFADELINSQFAPRIADIAVKLKDIDPAIKEELAERLVPPDVAAAKAQGEPDPAAIMAQMQQMGQQMKALNAYAQEIEEENKQLKAGIVAKQIDAQARLQEAQINAQSREKVAVIQVQAKLRDEAMRQDAETARTHLQGTIDMALQEKQNEAAEEMAEATRGSGEGEE